MGIEGLDQVLDGGVPASTTTVIRGQSGAGKTIFALSFAAGLPDQNGTAVYASFDEAPERLRSYIAAWGRGSNIHFIDLRPDPTLESTGGDVELGGILARISHAVRSTGASRLVLDDFGVLFDAFGNGPGIYRDLRKIFSFCEDLGITVVATARETGTQDGATYQVDYASDCLIRLTHRVEGDLMTRRLRVIKCRGKAHGTNEYPYLIGSHGVSLIPVTLAMQNPEASPVRMATGVDRLDQMLDGGFWQGSTIMISGQSGTGKSLLAQTITSTVCDAGNQVLYCSFEEAPHAIIRGSQSIGLDLTAHINAGRLELLARRAVEASLEQHLIELANKVRDTMPTLVVLDPISALADMGAVQSVKNTILRVCNSLRAMGVTVMLTELIPDDSNGLSSLNVSSLVDTWIRLRRVEGNGEFNRLVYIHKSRGSAISNQVKEFRITGHGIQIEDPYIGEGGVLLGSDRSARDAKDSLIQRELEAQVLILEKELTLRRQIAEHEAALSEAEQDLRQQAIQDQIRILRKQLTEEFDRSAAMKELRVR